MIQVDPSIQRIKPTLSSATDDEVRFDVFQVDRTVPVLIPDVVQTGPVRRPDGIMPRLHRKS